MTIIDSGVTTTLIPFVAVDDVTGSRKTGLSSFTVYRSRNGGAATVYTTPTIAELSAANAPGVYHLTADEDTTITSGKDHEPYILHITATGMLPVTKECTIRRPPVTAGQTLTVAAGVASASIGTGGLTRASFAADTGLQTIRSATAQAGAAGTITLDASASATTDYYRGAIIYTTGGTGVGQHRVCTAYNGTTKVATISPNWATNPDATTTFAVMQYGASNVTSITGTAVSTTTAQLGVNAVQAGATAWGSGAITAASIASNAITSAKIASGAITSTQLAADCIGSSQLAATAVTEIQTGLATSAALTVIDDFLDTEIATIITNQGTIAGYLDTEIAAIKAKTDNLPSDPADASDIATAFSGIDTKLDTIDNFIDTEVTAIKTVTDKLDTALVLDGAVYQLTANALELAPPNTGLDAAGVRAAIGLASADLDAQIATLATGAALTTVAGYIDTEVASILAAVDTEVAAIKAKTDNLPSDPADASDIAAAFAVTNGKIDVVDDYLDTELAAIKTVVDAILVDTDVIGATGAGLTSLASAANLATLDDFLDTEIAAIKAKTDNLPSDPAGQSLIIAAIDAVPTAAEIWAHGIEAGYTAEQLMRIFTAVLAGKVSGAGTGTESFRSIADGQDRVVSTVDPDGNRTAIVLDAS